MRGNFTENNEDAGRTETDPDASLGAALQLIDDLALRVAAVRQRIIATRKLIDVYAAVSLILLEIVILVLFDCLRHSCR